MSTWSRHACCLACCSAAVHAVAWDSTTCAARTLVALSRGWTRRRLTPRSSPATPARARPMARRATRDRPRRTRASSRMMRVARRCAPGRLVPARAPTRARSGAPRETARSAAAAPATAVPTAAFRAPPARWIARAPRVAGSTASSTPATSMRRRTRAQRASPATASEGRAAHFTTNALLVASQPTQVPSASCTSAVPSPSRSASVGSARPV